MENQMMYKSVIQFVKNIVEMVMQQNLCKE